MKARCRATGHGRSRREMDTPLSRSARRNSDLIHLNHLNHLIHMNFDVAFQCEDQMAERLGSRAVHRKVAGSIPGRAK